MLVILHVNDFPRATQNHRPRDLLLFAHISVSDLGQSCKIGSVKTRDVGLGGIGGRCGGWRVSIYDY